MRESVIDRKAKFTVLGSGSRAAFEVIKKIIRNRKFFIIVHIQMLFIRHPVSMRSFVLIH